MIVIESFFVFIVCFYTFEMFVYKYNLQHVEPEAPPPKRTYKKVPPPANIYKRKGGYNKNNRYVKFQINPKKPETPSGKAKTDL